MSVDPMPRGAGVVWAITLIALYYVYRYGKRSYRNLKERQDNKLVKINE